MKPPALSSLPSRGCHMTDTMNVDNSWHHRLGGVTYVVHIDYATEAETAESVRILDAAVRQIRQANELTHDGVRLDKAIKPRSGQ